MLTHAKATARVKSPSRENFHHVKELAQPKQRTAVSSNRGTTLGERVNLLHTERYAQFNKGSSGKKAMNSEENSNPRHSRIPQQEPQTAKEHPISTLRRTNTEKEALTSPNTKREKYQTRFSQTRQRLASTKSLERAKSPPSHTSRAQPTE